MNKIGRGYFLQNYPQHKECLIEIILDSNGKIFRKKIKYKKIKKNKFLFNSNYTIVVDEKINIKLVRKKTYSKKQLTEFLNDIYKSFE